MDREELEQLGVWERQVELSKLWAQLTTPVYRVKTDQGYSPLKAKVRRTEWPDCWLYVDEEGYQLLEEADVQRWLLVEKR
jgi:hypothetical protein